MEVTASPNDEETKCKIIKSKKIRTLEVIVLLRTGMKQFPLFINAMPINCLVNSAFFCTFLRIALRFLSNNNFKI